MACPGKVGDGLGRMGSGEPGLDGSSMKGSGYVLRKVDRQELRAIQLDILKKVDAFCRDNGLTYFLCYGTLLGAVRHKGYIPWDDDIDIAMPRPDYESFVRMFNGIFPSLKIAARELDPAFPFTYAKVFNAGTVLEEFADIRYELGIGIDIFPVDGLPEGAGRRKRLFGWIGLFRRLMELKAVRLSLSRSVFKNIVLLLGKLLLAWLPYSFLTGRIIRLAKAHPYEGAPVVGIAVWGYGAREAVPAGYFSNVCELDFEGHRFWAPVGYDGWLRALYGNYMELPPEDKRGTHHRFSAYVKE